jgi:hypothetical protein
LQSFFNPFKNYLNCLTNCFSGRKNLLNQILFPFLNNTCPAILSKFSIDSEFRNSSELEISFDSMQRLTSPKKSIPEFLFIYWKWLTSFKKNFLWIFRSTNRKSLHTKQIDISWIFVQPILGDIPFLSFFLKSKLIFVQIMKSFKTKPLSAEYVLIWVYVKACGSEVRGKSYYKLTFLRAYS